MIEEITRIYSSTATYDHRPYLTYDEKYDYIKQRDATEEYRVKYAWFKYSVARALKPSTMMEIGVRGGCSALAFLHACPDMRYLGIDSNLDGEIDHRDYLSSTRRWFRELGFKATILVGDSQDMYIFPSVDFIHIDGCHSRKCTDHDVSTAIYSDIPWILIDDSNTESVSDGINDAVLHFGGSVKRYDFRDTQGGNTLLFVEALR